MNGISERELEDYLCEHSELLQFDRFYVPEELFEESEVTIIGRQVVVEHGIIDLLTYCAATYPCVSVIELKTKPLQEKDVGQLLRYMWDIRGMLDFAHNSPTPAQVVEGFDELSSLREEMFWHIFQDQSFVQGVLIGPSIRSPIAAACQAADIEVCLYEVADERIELTDYRPSLVPAIIDERLSSKLHQTIYNYVFNQIDHYIDSELGRIIKQTSECADDR